MAPKKFQDTRIDTTFLRGMSVRCETYRMIEGTKMRERCVRDTGHSEKHVAFSGEEWEDE
jgi:hypothetical protein